MKRKGLATLVLTVGLVLSGTFSSLADVTAVIDISAYDTSVNSFGVSTEIYYKDYDSESDLIPINMNKSHAAFVTQEEDVSALVFINRKGETVIPANPNWELVAGFRHGVALVKDKTTGAVLRIDSSGNILGTIDVGNAFIRLLPVNSQYSYYYIVGNGGEYESPKDNFSIIFIDSSGQEKKVNLKDLGFHYIDYFDENGRAALSTGIYRGRHTSYWFDGTPFLTTDAYNLKQTAYIDINGNIVDGVITDKVKEYRKDNILLDKDGSNYVCDVYTLKRLENPYRGYEIYQNEAATGVIIYDIVSADNHTVIGRESVERVYDNGNHYFDKGRLMMYHIY